MKKSFYISGLLLIMPAFLFFSACEKEEEKTWGEVTIGFTIQNENNLSAPAQVQFINNSKNAEEYHWSFPGGNIIHEGTQLEDSTTTAIQPERVFYAVPGEYTAFLKIMANGEEKNFTKDFTVRKPTPQIINEPVGVVYDDTVTFRVEFFKYPGLEDQVTYNWDLGNGETSQSATPVTTYNPPGVYTITLELFDGVETLTVTKNLFVQAEIAKTLYFTNALNQRLFKKMLYTGTDLPAEQLNVDVGIHPLSVTVHQDRIVVTVTGNNIMFANDIPPADGYIFSTNLQGGSRYVITAPNPAGYDYRDDPFVGTVGPDGTVYFVSRMNGGRKISITEQNADYPELFIFHQASEGTPLAAAIGVASAFGWTDGAIRVVNNELWYSKHGTGRGLYRFDMAGGFISKFDNLFDLKIKTFEVDTQNGKIYFAVNSAAGGYDPGLYMCNIDGTNIQLIDPLTGFSLQGAGAEGIGTERTYVTSIVVDADGGYIYYPFRHNEDINYLGLIVGDGSKSGIKRWKMDGSEDPEFYVTGFIPYGIGIDHVKR